MGRNLGPLNIKDSYEGLVQISGSQLTNGSGSLIPSLEVTSSYAVTASYAENAGTSTLQQVTDNGAVTNVNGVAFATATNGGTIAVGSQARVYGQNSISSVFAGQTYTITGGTTVSKLVLTGNGNQTNIIRLNGADDLIQMSGSIESQDGITAPTINATTALTASGLIYPTVDGTVGQVVTTDGSGNLTLEDAAGGGAFPYTGSAQITGSLGVTGSISSDTDATINGITIGNRNGNVYNTVIGNNAGVNLIGSGGIENTIIGYGAGEDLTTAGNSNNLIGALAGLQITTGDENQVLGSNALKNNLTGNQNIAIGHNTAIGITGNGNTIIGNRLNTGAITDSIVIGVGSGVKKWESTGGTTTIYDTTLAITGIADVSASIAAAGGGGAAFPYTGSAQITGSLSVTGSASIGGKNNTISSTGFNNVILNDSGSITGTASHSFIAAGGEEDASTISAGVRNSMISARGGSIQGGARNSSIIAGLGNTINASSGVRQAGIFASRGASITGGGAYGQAIIGARSANVSHANSVVIGGNGLSSSKEEEVVVPALSTNAQVKGNVVVLTTAASATTMDCSLGNFFTLAMPSGGFTNLTATNITAGQTISVKITQNATPSSLSFAPAIVFNNASPFVVSSGAGLVDVITFISFDGTSLQATGLNDFQ